MKGCPSCQPGDVEASGPGVATCELCGEGFASLIAVTAALSRCASADAFNALLAEQKDSEYGCPACAAPFTSITLHDELMHVCKSCKAVWLHDGALARVAAKALAKQGAASVPVAKPAAPPAPAPVVAPRPAAPRKPRQPSPSVSRAIAVPDGSLSRGVKIAAAATMAALALGVFLIVRPAPSTPVGDRTVTFWPARVDTRELPLGSRKATLQTATRAAARGKGGGEQRVYFVPEVKGAYGAELLQHALGPTVRLTGETRQMGEMLIFNGEYEETAEGRTRHGRFRGYVRTDAAWILAVIGDDLELARSEEAERFLSSLAE